MSTKLTKRLTSLRSNRCYWMHQLEDSGISDTRRDKCEKKINKICREIADLMGCSEDCVYRSLNKGHRGRPKKT